MFSTVSRIGRLSFRFGAVFALGMGVLGVSLYLFATLEVRQEVDASLVEDRAILLGNGPIPDLATLRSRIAALETLHPASSRGHVLFDASHRLIYGTLRMRDPGPGFATITYRDVNSPRLRHGRALGIDLPGGNRLVIYAHSELLENLGKVLLPLILALLTATALGGLAVTFLLGREIGNRLSRTIQAADAIAAGDLTRRVRLDRLDGVFAEQARSFNRMLDRIDDLIRTQRQFSSNLAHDLRTPLTRLHGLLNEAGVRARGPQDGALVDAAKRECSSIIAIFDALLRLSEIEAGCHPSAMQPIALRPLIEDIAESMEPVLADRGGELHVRPLADVRAVADPELLTQLLVNMLENVALHTPPGTHATISLAQDPIRREVVLEIADNGPGLAPDERARVMRPFQRGHSSAHVRGSGLGLAIAQAIVRFHRGELHLSDNAPGLCVQIRLPQAPLAPHLANTDR